MQWYQVYKAVILKRQFLTPVFLHSHRKSIVFYSRKMAITRSNELRHSPADRDTKSSSRVIPIVITT
jgi:hypothetical protein